MELLIVVEEISKKQVSRTRKELQVVISAVQEAEGPKWRRMRGTYLMAEAALKKWRFQLKPAGEGISVWWLTVKRLGLGGAMVGGVVGREVGKVDTRDGKRKIGFWWCYLSPQSKLYSCTDSYVSPYIIVLLKLLSIGICFMVDKIPNHTREQVFEFPGSTVSWSCYVSSSCFIH